MTLNVNDMATSMIAATLTTNVPPVTATNQIFKLGKAIEDYIIDNIHAVWTWVGIYTPNGNPDSVSVINGICSQLQINLSASMATEHASALTILALQISTFIQTTMQLSVDRSHPATSAFSGTDTISCADFPPLIIPPTIFVNNINREDCFLKLSECIISQIILYQPLGIISGLRTPLHTGSSTACFLE